MSSSSSSSVREQSSSRLSEDIKLLGALLGEVIAEHNGVDIFNCVERVRQLSKEARSGDMNQFSELNKLLAGLSDEDACTVARAFSHFLNLANIAEQVHRVRRRQDYALQREPIPQKGSVEATFAALLKEGCSKEELFLGLNKLRINLVLTAHPTETLRRTIIIKHNKVARYLMELDNARLSAPERIELMLSLRTQIKSIWLTDDIIRSRPTPLEEARAGLSIVEQTLWDAVPQYCRSLDRVSHQMLGRALDVGQVPFTFGSWMGGDRDGNPYVTAEVTRDVCLLSRWMAFELYERDLHALFNELSLNIANDELRSLTQGQREPYRVVIKELLIEIQEQRKRDKLRAKGQQRSPLEESVFTEEMFLKKLRLMHDSLRESGAQDIADGLLYNLIKRTLCFGFSLAKLDIRQEASRHAAALDEITQAVGLGSYLNWSEDEKIEFFSAELKSRRPLINSKTEFSAETREVLATLAVLAEFGPHAFNSYIISMASEASDILAVELLQNEICGGRIVRVVPLFETESDLKNGPQVMRRLFGLDIYKTRINNSQEIMMGYSDSAKDAGRLAAAWALYQAQEELVALCKEQKIHLTLFHGRGGSIGRGGGPMYLALLSQPPGSIDGSIRVTEQGEMIQAKFGLTGIAQRNLDLYVGGTLSATLSAGCKPKPEWRALMTSLAQKSSEVYRDVVRGHPSFLEFFSLATPVSELGGLNIGSRPARRKGAPTLETLRAIPWIFAWTQTRLMLPVWLGMGDAMRSVLNSEKRDSFIAMVQEWPFLNSTLALVEMVLAKADVKIAECYEKELLADRDELRKLGEELRASLSLTQASVLEAIDEGNLLADNPVLKRSIRVRNPYVDPINLVQIEFMKRIRLRGDSPILKDGLLLTINGISAGMRITG